jgi:hypothetical protein
MPLFGATRVHPWINTKTNDEMFGVQAYVQKKWHHVTHEVDGKQTPMLFDTPEEAQKAADETREKLRRIAN